MTLEFRPPFQINPDAESDSQRSLDRFNQTLSNIGQGAMQRRQWELERAYKNTQEKRAQEEHYSKYGDPNWTPEQMTPQGPQPSGSVPWSSGTEGPQPPSTLTDQFMSWKQKQQAGPMDTYRQMLGDPRAGSVRRDAYLTGIKEQGSMEKEQSEIEKNRAMARMYSSGGPSAGNVQWKLNPYSGQYEAFPTKMPASAGQMFPTPGTSPSPSRAPMSGFSPPAARSSIPGDGLDYKTRMKRTAEKPKAQGSLNNTLREYDNMIAEAQAIRNDQSLSSATGMMTPLSRIPGTGAKRVAARLETLKAKTLLNTLSSLKDLSATGASGFGQLSNVEGENIRNSVSTLDPSQATQDFIASIDRFIEEMTQRKGTLKKTFSDTYGEDEGGGQDQERIRVRLKGSGQTGTIPPSKFDPSKHERLS